MCCSLFRGREELLAGEEVVPGHAEGREHLRELVGNIQHGHTHEHEDIREAEADRGENREDGELALAAHVVAMREDELQAERVIERNGHDERDRGAHKVVNVEELRERDEQRPVHREGENSHRSELVELLNHGFCERVAHVTTPNR